MTEGDRMFRRNAIAEDGNSWNGDRGPSILSSAGRHPRLSISVIEIDTAGSWYIVLTKISTEAMLFPLFPGHRFHIRVI